VSGNAGFGTSAGRLVAGRFECLPAEQILERFSGGLGPHKHAGVDSAAGGGGGGAVRASRQQVKQAKAQRPPPASRPDLWWPSGGVSWVCECPLNSRRIMRMSTKLPLNPLVRRRLWNDNVERCTPSWFPRRVVEALHFLPLCRSAHSTVLHLSRCSSYFWYWCGSSPLCRQPIQPYSLVSVLLLLLVLAWPPLR